MYGKKIAIQLKSYSISIRWILLWNFIFCLATGIHMVLYNLYLENILHDEQLIGKILGLNFIAQAIIFIPAGLLADRIGSRRSLLMGLTLLLVGFIGNLTADNYALLYTWGFIIGLGTAASNVMFVPILTEFSKPGDRAALFSLAFGSGTFAMFIGTLLGGYIVESLQFLLNTNMLSSFRITLGLTTLLIVLCSIPLLFVKEERRQKGNGLKTLLLFKQLYQEQSGLKNILKFSMSKALSGLSIGFIIPFMNLFFYSRFELSASKISLILAFGTLVTVIFMAYNARLVKWAGEAKTVTLFHLLAIPTILILGISENVWVAAIGFIIYRSAKFALTPVESKVMIDQVHDSFKGLANSAGFMANSMVIGMVGPLSMHVVINFGYYKGYLFLCILSAFFSFCSAVYFYLAFRLPVSEARENLLQEAQG